MKSGPLILGARGQIGQMLRHLWQRGHIEFGGEPIWHARSPLSGVSSKQTLIWDMLTEAPPAISPDSVICLAGGPGAGDNVGLALAAVQVAHGAPVVFVSTQAVYGPQAGVLSEDSACAPMGDYGRSKLAAERAIASFPNVLSLRVGNVIGADALTRSMSRGPVFLDQFPDGQSPRRMMIGVQTFGKALVDLIALDPVSEGVLNMAQPGSVAMADLLSADDAAWDWQPAPEGAIPALEMDLRRIGALIDLPPADPQQLLREARLAGWDRHQ